MLEKPVRHRLRWSILALIDGAMIFLLAIIGYGYREAGGPPWGFQDTFLTAIISYPVQWIETAGFGLWETVGYIGLITILLSPLIVIAPPETAYRVVTGFRNFLGAVADPGIGRPESLGKYLQSIGRPKRDRPDFTLHKGSMTAGEKRSEGATPEHGSSEESELMIGSDGSRDVSSFRLNEPPTQEGPKKPQRGPATPVDHHPGRTDGGDPAPSTKLESDESMAGPASNHSGHNGVSELLNRDTQTVDDNIDSLIEAKEKIETLRTRINEAADTSH